MVNRLTTLATCSLNQWAMDFEGNLKRVLQSIEVAKERGAVYRVGPELELPGYGCEDHFLELDTVQHSWECLAEILQSDATSGIVCDVGMPVIHRGVLYNCRVTILRDKVLLIRPKLALANDSNYRETRYFAAWKHRGHVEEHTLPACVQEVTGQVTCPFGDGVLKLHDMTLASETCEELFTPQAPHIDLALAGIEVISNGSGSHHQLRKLDTRLDLIRSATSKAGGVYLYANQRGCDGGRLYYDGCACIAVNGELVAQGAQFGLMEVDVVTATVDLDEVVSYRSAISSLREQASLSKCPHSISVDFKATRSSGNVTKPISPKIMLPEEEICYGPACWLWDYLRRSGAAGFLLPLSGGADSSSVAAIVGAMAQMLAAAVAAGDEHVMADLTRITGTNCDIAAVNAGVLANYLLTTVYLGTENSSEQTRKRSVTLADQVGSYHLSIGIDTLVSAVVTLFTSVFGKTPRFRVDGGTPAENLALQNIQARLRMVVAFLLAQLVPWVRGRTGFLLVLGAANVDEGLRGYLTKYDCSSADINPIGGISKLDIRRFLKWGAVALGYPVLAQVEAASPTAELEPLREGVKPQNDEDDMGMTYEELSIYGRLRKISRCGPVSMFARCLQLWQDTLSPTAVAAKVASFFRYYSINRHKMTVITPSYHAENYSPDDNRFDHRQFLYNTRWPWQFKKMEELAKKAETEHEART